MYAKTVHGHWPRELNVWTRYHQIKRHCRSHKIHTQSQNDEVQFGALIWATAKAENKKKDASVAATRRVISHPTVTQVGNNLRWKGWGGRVLFYASIACTSRNP